MQLDYYLDLGPYERPEPIDWSTTPRLGQGSRPASWRH